MAAANTHMVEKENKNGGNDNALSSR